MRKTISVTLVAVMLLAMLAVGISAATPEGTAIGTAAEFAQMTADGNYYLSADIMITESYANPFIGKFDGNGHTVTITVPMFKEFSGKISNLTIRGNDLTGKEDLAPLAVKTNGMTAVGLTNYVNVKVTGISEDKLSGLNAGGFIADADDKGLSLCKFRKCINYGAVTVETAEVKKETTGANYETHAGGLIGRAGGLDAAFCENNGNIIAASINGQAGGMAGRTVWVASSNKDINYLELLDCTNTGDITSGLDAGGMIGYNGVGSNDIYREYKISYCTNTGTINGGYRAGGIMGYCYSSGKNLTYYLEILGCISIGDVYTGRAAATLDGTAQYSFGSLFVGYSNSKYNSIKYSLGQGELKANVSPDPTNKPYTEPYFCIMGCSSASTMEMPLNDNYICDNQTTIWYSYATDDANSAQRIEIKQGLDANKVTRCTADEVKNGTVMGKINTAAKADTVLGLTQDIFAQAANETAPKINTVLRAEREVADIVLLGKDDETEASTTTKDPFDTTVEATNPPKTNDNGQTTTKAPSNTTVPSDTTTDDTVVKKGCGSFAVAAQIIALVIGSAAVVVVKKKH